MTLTLSMLRCPDAVPPQTRAIKGGEFTIGRGPDNDWVLPDPDKVLSKRHCTVAFRAGSWQVLDSSMNGTFLNRDNQPVGQGGVRELRDGDRLRLGPYEVELGIQQDAAQAWQRDEGSRRPSTGRAAAGFDDDPLRAEPQRGDNPFDKERWPPSPAAFKEGFGAGADDPGDPKLPDDFGFDMDDFPPGPAQFDHAPATEQSFAAPRPAPPDIPADWDLDLPPTQKPEPPAAPAPQPVTEPPSRAPVGQDDLMAAFLRGARMPDARPSDTVATMERLGAALRAMVGGLRETLIARAAVKGEFRIEQTLIRASGNNPLKFSAGDDDAVAALLGVGRRSDMAPADAISDALRDIRLHELATMAAMQAAVRALLKRLDPAKLRDEAERGGGLLPAQRRARAFENFEKLHGDITRGLADDFDSVFGRAFARAYEQALREVSTGEPPRR